MAFLAKKRKQNIEEVVSDDEDRLAKKLFSDGDCLFQNVEQSDSESGSDDEPPSTTEVGHHSSSNRASAWHDEDDDVEQTVELSKSRTSNLLKKSTDRGTKIAQSELQSRLREVYTRVSSRGRQPKWAVIKKEKELGSDDEVDSIVNSITRSTGKYIDKPDRLPKGFLSARKLQDIAIGHAETKSINVIRFHRSKPVLVVASEAGNIRLFKVDSEVKKEHFLQSITFKRFPITSCDFGPGASSLILGSRSQKYFMHYDMNRNTVTQMPLPKGIPPQNTGLFCVSTDAALLAMVGHRGQVYILSTTSLDHIHTFSAPNDIQALQFFPGSSDELWALTVRGEVFVWQLSTKSQHSFLNEGAVRGTTLAISPDGTFVAVGENTGFVNVYETDVVRKEKRPPVRFNVSNLVTAVESLAFNHDSQVLAVCSSVKNNQIRLVHTASSSAFQNFPSRTDQVPHVCSVAFSPKSGFLALGLKSGAIRMYRMEHFAEY